MIKYIDIKMVMVKVKSELTDLHPVNRIVAIWNLVMAAVSDGVIVLEIGNSELHTTPLCFWQINLQGCTGFGYFKSDRSRTSPVLGTRIRLWLGLGRTCHHSTQQYTWWNYTASTMLSAAIKRQYISVFLLLHHYLPVFFKQNLWNGNECCI